MRTAVVLLNYNGLHWLRAFLPLVVERSPEADVVVIDNGSTEPGTLEWLKSEHPSVSVVALERNLGYAGGYQEGLRQLEGYDEIVVDGIAEAVKKDGYRMQTLLTQIVTSYPFTHRRTQEQGVPSNAKKLAN
jgi:GT2 family glycosyltransferase